MKRILDEYDTKKLMEALKLIKEVYEYNYDGYSPLSNKLGTIYNKLDNIITEQEAIHG